MLQKACQTPLYSVGNDDDLNLLSHSSTGGDGAAIRASSSTAFLESDPDRRKEKILSHLLSWKKSLHQCGMRWNYHVAIDEAIRKRNETPWSRKELSILSNCITISNRVYPDGPYSAFHWETITTNLIKEKVVESWRHDDEGAGLQQFSSAAPAVLPSLQSLRTNAPIVATMPINTPAMVPLSDAPPMARLLQPTSSTEAPTGMCHRSCASCFDQSQKVAMALFRNAVRVIKHGILLHGSQKYWRLSCILYILQEVKKMIHYIGLTKKDLIQSLTTKEKKTFWTSLFVSCRMKFLSADECRGKVKILSPYSAFIAKTLNTNVFLLQLCGRNLSWEESP